MPGGVIREDTIQVKFTVDDGGLIKAENRLNKIGNSLGSLGARVRNPFESITLGAQKAAQAASTFARSMTSVGGADRIVDGINTDLLTFNAYADAARDKINRFKSALNAFKASPLKALDRQLLAIQMSVGRTTAEFRRLASEKLGNLKNNLTQIKTALTGGEKGAKGFANALKVIGTSTVSKLASGISNVKAKLAEGVTKAGQFASKLKEAAGVGFGKLTSGIKSAVSALGRGLVSGAKGVAVAAGAAATGVAALVTNSVKAYADTEQLVGGVETLFGARGAKSVEEYAQLVGKSVSAVQDEYGNLMKAQSTVLQNANNAWKTSGLSANQYMETVTSFSASLIQSVGGDTQKAADMADMALQDMADNANKMGSDMDMIMQTYQSIARGNYGMLDNLKLGYGGTKAEMERLVKDAAKLDKSIDANSMSYGNIVKAIHAVQNEMGITGTTQLEAEKTITGSLSAMKAAWENTLSALVTGGDTLDSSIDTLVTTVGNFAKNIIPAARSALSGVGKLIETLAPTIGQALPELVASLLPDFVNGVIQLINSLLDAIVSNADNIAASIGTIASIVANHFGSILAELPLMLMQVLSSAASVLGNILPSLVDDLLNNFYMLIDNAPDMAQCGIDIVMSLANGIINTVPVILTYAPLIIKNFVNGFLNSFGMFMDAGTQLINTLGNAIIQNIPYISQTAVSIIQSLVNGVMENLPILINGAVQMINALIQGLIEGLPVIISAGLQIVTSLITSIVEMLPAIIEMGMQLIFSLVNGILQAIPQIITAVVPAVTTFINSLVEMLPMIIETGIQIIVSLVAGLIQAIPQIIACIPQIVSALWDGLTSINWIELGWNIIKGIGSGIVNGLKSLFGVGEDAGESASSGFESGVSAKGSSLMITASSLSNNTASAFGSGNSTALTRGSQMSSSFTSGLATNAGTSTMTASSISTNTANAFGTNLNTAQYGSSMTNNFTSGMTNATQDPVQQAKSISTEVQTALNQAKETIAVSADAIIAKLTEIKINITEAMQACQTSIGENMAESFSKMQISLQNVITSIARFKTSVSESISAFSDLGSAASAAMVAIASGASTGLGSLVAVASSVMAIFVAIIMQAISDAEKIMSTGVNSMARILAAGLAALVSAAQSQMSAFVSAIRSGCNRAVSAARSGANGIKSAFSGISLSSVGANLMQGLVNGMNSKRSAVVSTAKSLANAAKSAVEAAAQVASPSKVFAKIGGYFGSGLVVGMQDTVPQVKRAGSEMAYAATYQTELSGYTPESSSSVTNNRRVEYNDFSPQFNLTISGSNEDRALARKVRQWLREEIAEMMESASRKNPALVEV